MLIKPKPGLRYNKKKPDGPQYGPKKEPESEYKGPKAPCLTEMQQTTMKRERPSLKPGQRPLYWQWRDRCGHAKEVDEKKKIQVCGGCACVFKETEMVVPEELGGTLTCSLEGYRKMKDIQNMF